MYVTSVVHCKWDYATLVIHCRLDLCKTSCALSFGLMQHELFSWIIQLLCALPASRFQATALSFTPHGSTLLVTLADHTVSAFCLGVCL